MQHRVGCGEDAETFGTIQIRALRARKHTDLEAVFERGTGAARNIAVARDQQAFHRRHCSEMHSVTLQPSGHQFQVEDGEAVLAAALRQGFVLPYGCKNGACGSCKCRILAGAVDYGVYQAKTLTDEEKAQGKALLCQAKPLSEDR